MTSRRAILRLVWKSVEPSGVRRLEYTGLTGREEWAIEEYSIVYRGLIIQYPEMPDAFLYEDRTLEFAPGPWEQYCRWHSGPLWEKDDPTRRLYCTARAEGYCRQHKRSERALYEYCMSLNGERALSACRALDNIARVEYALYLTDGGAGRLKVGVTRLFRLRERIAEQPHGVATLVAVFDSAYQARRAEMTISRRGLASERRARKPRHGLGLAEAARIVASGAERIASLLGVEWDGTLFRVASPAERLVRAGREARPENLEGRRLRISGYWGGYLVLEPGPLVVSDRKLAHRDSLVVDENI